GSASCTCCNHAPTRRSPGSKRGEPYGRGLLTRIISSRPPMASKASWNSPAPNSPKRRGWWAPIGIRASPGRGPMATSTRRRCAVEVQQAMPERNTGAGADNRIELRIGINLGDVIVEGDDLYGDGVNIAARVEALADAGGVFVSNTVHDHVRDRLPFSFEDLGEQQVKNTTRPVRVYRVGPRPSRPPAGGTAAVQPETPPALPLPDKPSIAVLPF